MEKNNKKTSKSREIPERRAKKLRTGHPNM